MDHPPRLGTVLAWSAYLACSWTWCIGMWLPVILMRDFGQASFPIFALPNMAGAILMGMLLVRPGASERFVRVHRSACEAFSFVTVAFQTFFLIWLLAGLGGSLLSRLLCLGLFLLPILVMGESVTGPSRENRPRQIACLVYLVSAAMGVWWLIAAAPTSAPVPPPNIAGLGPLAGVCLLGFMLCPYLDLTFHRARQRLAGTAGNAAFVIGFGLMFFLMILMTFLYARPTLAVANGSPVHPALAAWPVVIHMLVQLGFTYGVHSAEFREADGIGPSLFSRIGLGGAVMLALGLYIGVAYVPVPSRLGLTGNELIYRLFMSFYGLVFPAYVWTCVRSLRNDAPGPGRLQLAVFGITVLAAAPMFWMGFIERRYQWLLLGVAVVVLARLPAQMPGSRARPAA